MLVRWQWARGWAEAHEHTTAGQSMLRATTLPLKSQRSDQRKGSSHVFLDYLGHLCSPGPALAAGDLAESARGAAGT